MDIQPVRTEQQYQGALERISTLMDARPGSAEGDELDVLTTLVERYERQHFPVEAPDPVSFLRQVMEFRGESQNALAQVLNSRSRASEVLNRRRPLTLDQIRRICRAWNVPAEPLIAEYSLASGQ